MNNKEVVDKALRKLQNSMWKENIINGMILSILVSAAACLGIVLTAHMRTVAYLLHKCFIAALLIFLIGLLWGIFRRPSLKSAALKGDSLGLMDRLITYVEYNNKDGWLIDMFIEELSDTLKSSQLVKKYSGKIMWKKLAIAAIIYTVTAAAYFLPSVHMDNAAKAEAVNKELKEEARKLASLSQELEKEKNGNERYAKKADDIVKELERKLDKGFAYDEAALDISIALDEIERIGGKSGAEGAEALGLMLQGVEGAASASEELEEKLSALSWNEAQQNKMLENINNMKNSKKAYSQALENTLDEIQEELDKGELNGKKLDELMKPFFEDRKEFAASEKLNIKLEEMKERLLAKEDGGIKAEGEEKSEDFAYGSNDEHGQGEASMENSKNLIVGGNGNQASKNPEGMGGGITGGEEASQSDSLLGQMDKKSSTLEAEGGKKTAEVKGSWQDKAGAISNKLSNDVMQSKGEAFKLEEIYRSFGHNPIEYSKRFDICEEYRPLVVEYFKRLNGGK